MILLASFLSGAAGLVFELLWSKRLGLLFGSAAVAQACVLATFLGGLALGSERLGKRADAAPEPLRFYANLEWLVALYGLLAPALLHMADGRAKLSAPLAVLFHAFLMGGAVPALCRAAGGDAQRSVGRVYASNALGASLGVLAAAFVLIPALGLDWAGFAAGSALNVLAGLAALRAAAPSGPAPAPAPAHKGKPAQPDLPLELVLGAALLSGCAAIVYESAWTRVLALTLGGSTYSFAEMLAGLILGLSVGGALASSALLRRRSPATVLGWACLAAGAATLAGLPVAWRLPYLFAKLRSALPAATFHGLETGKFLLCAGVMLPVAAALGVVPAVCARLCDDGDRARGGSVGRLLAANSLGNALGAAAGLWLLPSLGLEGTLRAGASLHLLTGALVLFVAGGARKAGLALALAGLAAAAVAPRWDSRFFARGIYRGLSRLGAGFEDYLVYHRATKQLYHKDDREATVDVLLYENGQLSINVNGKADASNGSDMVTQVLMGALPLLLKPDAQAALVIGWGSGMSVGAALRGPIPRVDAVELIPGVVEGSRAFDAYNGRPQEDPRLSIAVEDAKSFLLRPGPSYDVIASEPSNPWMAGIADLFSVEFYARARQRLAPGGLFVQWFHTYEMDDDGFRLVLRTLRAVFPHVTIWRGSFGDALLIASDRPLALDDAAFERAYMSPAVWRGLSEVDIGAPTALLSLQSASEEGAKELAGEGPVNSELRPILEYQAPRAFFRHDMVRALDLADERADRVKRERLLLAGFLKRRGKPLQPREFRAWAAMRHGGDDFAAVALTLEDWKRLYPRDEGYASALKLLQR